MTITTPDGRRWNWYAPGLQEHVVEFVVTPDPRDERIAELTTALRHIQLLADDCAALEANGLDFVLDTIALLAADALIGAMPEPERSMERVDEEWDA